jgi:hypothetical protein
MIQAEAPKRRRSAEKKRAACCRAPGCLRPATACAGVGEVLLTEKIYQKVELRWRELRSAGSSSAAGPGQGAQRLGGSGHEGHAALALCTEKRERATKKQSRDTFCPVAEFISVAQ